MVSFPVRKIQTMENVAGGVVDEKDLHDSFRSPIMTWAKRAKPILFGTGRIRGSV